MSGLSRRIIGTALHLACLIACVISISTFAADPFSQGQNLFSNAGCSTCHTASIQVVAKGENLGQEMPPRSRILTRLRVLAAILQERESHGEFPTSAHCNYYREFSAEYARINKLIREGNPVFPMPSWEQRASGTGSTDSDGDIRSIINYLLVSEGLVFDQATISRWTQMPAVCDDTSTSRQVTTVSHSGVTSLQSIALDSNRQRRTEILDYLNRLDQSSEIFRNTPSVSFLSYQNYLFNKIGYIPGQTIDVWLLQQAGLDELYYDVSKILTGNRFPNLLLFVIAVDKSELPYRAYYFRRSDTTRRYIYARPERFPPSLVINNRNPLDDADTAGCFECHASGPLRLRPRRWETIPDLTRQDWQKMTEMNQRLLTYGAVTTDMPDTGKPLTEYDRAPLTQEACSQCHNSQGIRAPVLRYHSKVVVALMNAHEGADGYFEYNIPKPDLFRYPEKMQTYWPSISYTNLAAMPPLMPLSEHENAQLFQWIGKVRDN